MLEIHLILLIHRPFGMLAKLESMHLKYGVQPKRLLRFEQVLSKLLKQVWNLLELWTKVKTR